MHLGRVAVERISQNADRLQDLVRDNGAQVDAIAHVSSSALDNMDRLRGQLPVIASSAKDVTNNIANAGRVAHAHLEDMVAGFRRLNEFGQASERQVVSLRGHVDTALGEFRAQAEQLDAIAQDRFAALAERGAEFRTQLDGHEIEALAAIRTRAGALAAELEDNRNQLDADEAESLTSLRARLTLLRDEGAALNRALRENDQAAQLAWTQATERLEADVRQAMTTIEGLDRQAIEHARARLTDLAGEAARFENGLHERNLAFVEDLRQREAAADEQNTKTIQRVAGLFAAIDAQMAQRRAAHEAQAAQLVAQGEALDGKLGQFGISLQNIAAHGSAAEASVAASIDALAQRLVASRDALGGTDAAVAQLTDHAGRLLELIEASAAQTRVDIPQAMASNQSQLESLEARLLGLRDVVREAHGYGASLSNYVIESNDRLGSGLGQLDQLHLGLATQTETHHAALSELAQSLAAIRSESDAIAAHAQGELRDAVFLLTGTAGDAVASLGTSTKAAVTAIAEQLSLETGAALDRVLRVRSAEAAGQLEQAAAHAAGVSREAAIQLRDQLAKVNDLTGNLEQRVAQARASAEDQVDNDFSRRVALITEALNSHAIDITKALSTEVTDMAWAAYLRGDRGIFTRRAVRLLDGTETRTIAEIYETEREFRDHVSHYIHDFEAMLRQLLSTRDGHALGVTVLSSDMGKLYVALAQAIERLRA